MILQLNLLRISESEPQGISSYVRKVAKRHIKFKFNYYDNHANFVSSYSNVGALDHISDHMNLFLERTILKNYGEFAINSYGIVSLLIIVSQKFPLYPFIERLNENYHSKLFECTDVEICNISSLEEVYIHEFMKDENEKEKFRNSLLQFDFKKKASR